MGTKTLTIMDDVYELLVRNKLENESFSEEIRRIFADKRKRSLMDFYGILSDKEGAEILNVIKRKKIANIKRVKERMELFR